MKVVSVAQLMCPWWVCSSGCVSLSAMWKAHLCESDPMRLDCVWGIGHRHNERLARVVEVWVWDWRVDEAAFCVWRY